MKVGLDQVLVSMGNTPYLAYKGPHLEKVNGRFRFSDFRYGP